MEERRFTFRVMLRPEEDMDPGDCDARPYAAKHQVWADSEEEAIDELHDELGTSLVRIVAILEEVTASDLRRSQAYHHAPEPRTGHKEARRRANRARWAE